jgi:hypothetical protein
MVQLRAHYSKPPETQNLPECRSTQAQQHGALVEQESEDDVENQLDSEREGDKDNEDEDEGEDEVDFVQAFMTSTQMNTVNEHQPQTQNCKTIYIVLVNAVKYALSTSAETEPSTLAKALKRPDADKYLECVMEEVKAHLDNSTWKVI